MADTRVAMSRKPPPDPIVLGAPELSPDGRLAALGVTFDEYLPRLVVFDIDREELVVVDRPDNEGGTGSRSFDTARQDARRSGRAFRSPCSTGIAARRRRSPEGRTCNDTRRCSPRTGSTSCLLQMISYGRKTVLQGVSGGVTTSTTHLPVVGPFGWST